MILFYIFTIITPQAALWHLYGLSRRASSFSASKGVVTQAILFSSAIQYFQSSFPLAFDAFSGFVSSSAIHACGCLPVDDDKMIFLSDIADGGSLFCSMPLPLSFWDARHHTPFNEWWLGAGRLSLISVWHSLIASIFSFDIRQTSRSIIQSLTGHRLRMECFIRGMRTFTTLFTPPPHSTLIEALLWYTLLRSFPALP